MKKNKSACFFGKEKRVKWCQMMHLTLLLMLCLNLTLSAKVFAQAEKCSVRKDNVTVKEVFEAVMQQTGYHFFYNNEFDVNRLISIHIKNGTIEEVLRRVLEGQAYSYKLVDNYVIIKKKTEQLVPPSQQTRPIRGVVKDTEGLPLPGVSVMVKGETIGVATDIDGKFNLVVPDSGAVLRFSFIGKKTQEVVVQHETYFDITLEDDEKMLGEVVCTGVQTISRERATGAFEILSADALNKTLTPDVISRFQGKIAGVQVDQHNKLTIRGRGSIHSDTEPLIVVDGFPIEGGLQSVNPDDISSMTVLKDAAAASIWGVRAGNGVIVITTKSGEKKEKPALDVSYFLTVNSKPKMKDLHLASSADAIDLQLEQIQKGYWDPYYMEVPLEGTTALQEAYYAAYLRTDRRGGYEDILKDAEFQKEIAKLKSYDFAGQYEKMLLRKAVGNRVNISLRGGSERSDYYLSGVYNRQLMEYVGDKNSELLINFKHNYRLLDRLTFSTAVNVQYQETENNGIPEFYAIAEQPYQRLVDEQGNRVQSYAFPKAIAQEKEQLGYLSYSHNLLDDRDVNDNTTHVFSTRLQGALKLNLTEGLNAETRFQYERGYTNHEIYDVVAKYSTRKEINDLTLVNSDGSLNRQIPLGDIYHQNRTDYMAWTWRSQLTLNREWNDQHSVAAVLGYEMRKYGSRFRNQRLYGYDRVALTYIPINESDLVNNRLDSWDLYGMLMQGDRSLLNAFGESDNRDISVYMNGSYTFSNRYTFSASGRIDQSNLFGNDSDYKYNFIWSTGLSWRVSEEEFIQADWINQLLLRVTYGIGGNINKNFYPVLMGRKGVWSGSGLPYIRLTNPANKDLTWEKTTTFNAGLDFSFCSYRISGSLDYYHKKSTDLLGTVSLDPTNGFASATKNFASMLNQGFELSVNVEAVRTKDFTWDLNFNVSYNKNRVEKIEVAGNAEEDYLISEAAGVVVKGKPLNRLYAYRYAGLDDQGEVMLWQQGKKVHFSEYEQNPDDLAFMGSTEAPWYGGISTGLTYKGITLAASATYKFGHKFRLPVASPSVSWWPMDNIRDRWKQAGDVTDVPVLTRDWKTQSIMEKYYTYSDIHVRNASWVRLNELSLGYQVPGEMLKKLPVKGLSVQFQVRNVCQWTANKEHVDPESIPPLVSNLYVYSGYSFPQPRSFILGVKLTF